MATHSRPAHQPEFEADVIIVGAGSTGATLAARLSEEPRRNVLLIEAGQDTPPGAVPPDVSDTFPLSYSNPDYTWTGLSASFTEHGEKQNFTQARIMGGGSSLMGMWALRGLAADYDRWRDAGAEGWGWDDLRPVFDRLEDDPLQDPHGDQRGPVAIRRIDQAEWPAYIRAAQRAAMRLGYPSMLDINRTDEDGFFPIPLSQHEGQRASSATSYLTADVRRRHNLRILTDTEVTRIVFDGTRVSGVVATRAAEALLCCAPEVIVCCGAIHSPALLLRSGIGAARQLQALGIDVVNDLPGVGNALANHVCINIGLTLPPAARQRNDLHNYGVACMRASSGLAPGNPSDLLLAFTGRTSLRRIGTRVPVLGIFLYDPLSRGRVTIERDGDALRPKIAFNLMSAQEDCSRMAQGLRLALQILGSPESAGTWREAFLLPPTAPLQKINRPGILGALPSLAALAIFGGGSTARRAALEVLVKRSAFLDPYTVDRLSCDHLESLAREAATPMFHVAGTCAMGDPRQRAIVVDPKCRVSGVQGLRVVDCSIMPRLPRANTNIPAIMIAERVAELMASESM